jgi:hypothetical protein
MISDELLKIYDEMELKATPRPWSSFIRRRPGYGKLVFWERRPLMEVIFDCEQDARYLAFIRNIVPELVKEVRELRRELAQLRRNKTDP